METDPTGKRPEEPSKPALGKDAPTWRTGGLVMGLFSTLYSDPSGLKDSSVQGYTKGELPDVKLAKIVLRNFRTGVEKAVTVFQTGTQKAGEIFHKPQQGK